MLIMVFSLFLMICLCNYQRALDPEFSESRRVNTLRFSYLLIFVPRFRLDFRVRHKLHLEYSALRTLRDPMTTLSSLSVYETQLPCTEMLFVTQLFDIGFLGFLIVSSLCRSFEMRKNLRFWRL